MRQGSNHRWWLPIVLMVPMFLAVALIARHPIESDLTGRARSALAAGGIEGVSVDGSWADIHLSGPASQREAALASVNAMTSRGDAHSISYSVVGTAAPTTSPTSTSSASTTVPATTLQPAPPPGGVDLVVSTEANKLTLTGFVATDAEKTALVGAATAVYGPGNVNDRLVVQGTAPSAAVEGAVGQLELVVTAFGSRVQVGQAHLVDTALTVSGTAFTREAATAMADTLATARLAGLKVDGSIAAPAAADPATLQAQLKDLLGRSGINFATNSAEITPASALILDPAGQAIAQVPGVKVQIAGYTDERGTAALNQTLSERRADAVRDYLVSKGVPASQLTAVGFGQSRPVASNDTEAGRSANRRIEFTVGS